MSDFQLTKEQEAILAQAKSSDSLIITALAGAAKTTTLCLLAKKLPLVPTLCCAFNKKIADEMGKRMPGHIQCSTMNSLGHRAWGAKLGRRLSLDADKGYTILSELMERQTPEQKKKLGEVFAAVLRAVRLAKSSGYVPEKFKTLGKGLIHLDDFLDSVAADIDIEPDDEFIDWFHHCLETSITQAFEGRIDFDDQIYMSTLFGAAFTKFAIIMVDEAQDLSPLNHEMLRKMFGGRLIAVGDPYQAIYAFRGAHIGSMDLLKQEFNCKELFLSISFRCPKAVVERAKMRAPNMQAPDWAKEGEVRRLGEWTADDLHDGDWVICRNNAPLFGIALKMIRAGRGVQIRGNEIGKALIKILDKMGPGTMPREQVLSGIEAWQKKELEKARESRKAGINDRADCLRVFAEFGQTLQESIAYAQHLFEMSGQIVFMTGHKSKGLENPRVWHLDSYLIPSKFALRCAEEGDNSKLDQERNLRYVIETRSQDFLGFIATEDYRAI